MRFTRVKIDNFFNLKDVNLDLTNGNTLIVGPNGSGKTNIIKCIHFLVNAILGQCEGYEYKSLYHYGQPDQFQRVIQHVLLREDTSPKIWSPNEDCFIEVHAWFNKAEVELFSELRLLFLMSDVCYVVCNVTKFLIEQAMAHVQKVNADQGTPPGSVSERKEKLIRAVLQDKEGMFFHFPETTFREIINTRSDYQLSRDTRCTENIPFDDPCVSSLATKITERLFPKLLEITRRALSEQDHPMKGCDVVMQARKPKAVDKLECSLDM